MTLSLDHMVVNHPSLKEDVELLVWHDDYVMFRTGAYHTCGQYGEYEKQTWYVQDLSSGAVVPAANSEKFGGHINPDYLVIDGVQYDARPSIHVVTRTIGALVSSQVSGDDVRKGLESSGVDMRSLYPSNYKLEKNFLGGWSVKTAETGYSVADFLVRLAEMTTI